MPEIAVWVSEGFVGPMIVRLLPFCESVMLVPPATTSVPEEISAVTPEVLPAMMTSLMIFWVCMVCPGIKSTIAHPVVQMDCEHSICSIN